MVTLTSATLLQGACLQMAVGVCAFRVKGQPRRFGVRLEGQGPLGRTGSDTVNSEQSWCISPQEREAKGELSTPPGYLSLWGPLGAPTLPLVTH